MDAIARSILSRRTALAGLGAGGLGLAVGATARGIAAQDAAGERASHPIIGAWTTAADPAQPGSVFAYVVFHADGTRIDVNQFSGTGVGVWRATGERTGESMIKFQNISPKWGGFVPGTATVWSSFTVDENGDAFALEDVVELRQADGTVVALFPSGGILTRLVVELTPVPFGTPTP
jgi:hypothetical protein